MKVFICDDDKDLLEFIFTLLTETGYEVYATINCKDNLIETIKNYQPDLIIFDYWLNDSKSDKIIAEIKQYNSLKKIPIILISAIADLDEVVEGIPINDYMKKPFDIYDLLYKIRNIVQYA